MWAKNSLLFVLDCLRYHLDRAARALSRAHAATFAVVVVERKTFAWPELDNDGLRQSR